MQLQSLLRYSILLLSFTLLNACATVEHLRIDHVPALHGQTSPTAMAGVAITDITPPPGLPKSGYSIPVS